METIEETRARIREIAAGPGKTSCWISQHLEHADKHKCLIWPFAWEAGHYPKFRKKTGEKNWPVHRMMCEYRLGPPPSDEHHAAHSCGRGLQGCVNPMHVSWKTPSENQSDRSLGGINPRFKLTPEIADQIRVMGLKMQPGEIAKRFGVTVRNVRFILSGKAWSTKAPRIFSEEEVLDIRRRFGSEPAPALAAEFGCSRQAIGRIGRCEVYRWVKEREADKNSASLCH